MLMLGSFDLYKPVPDEMLNLTQLQPPLILTDFYNFHIILIAKK